jgi:large subunit ribosomal protein L21
LFLYQSFIFLQTQNKTEISNSMYAIVSIAGQQFKVEKGKKVFVHRLAGEPGDEVSFSQVMLIQHEDATSVGAPYIQDAVVLAQIVSHDRGDKVLVFKKKRRKGYQKMNGHRQDFTQILIEDISTTGAPVRTEKKKAAPKAEVAEGEVAAAAEKPAAKQAAKQAKKPAAKAAAEEKPKKAAPKKAEAKPAAKKAAKKDTSKE